MRILIADNDLRVRAALHVLLAEQDDSIVIAECADIEGLVDQLHDFAPQLVLLDWELPGRPATAFLLARSHAARPKLIVLSTRLEIRAAALTIGADDFVHKADPPDALLASVRKVMGGQLRCGALDVQPAP
jgi:DNA-binding NarL/FixJ family response regulator